MWIAAFCQPQPLPSSQIVHQALIFDFAVQIRPWGDMAVHKACFRRGSVSMEVGEYRVSSRLCRTFNCVEGEHGLHESLDSPAILLDTVTAAPCGMLFNQRQV